jgi:hypothetical protein
MKTLSYDKRIKGKNDMDWQPASEAPNNTWLRTKLEGEDGENVCALHIHPDGTREWVERHHGRTTITHNSFAAPSHFKYLDK